MRAMGRIDADYEEKLMLKQDAAEELYEALDEAITYVAAMASFIKNEPAHAAFLDKCTHALARARGES